MRECIRSGKTESELVSHMESIMIARIEDEIRKQIGVEYPDDKMWEIFWCSEYII